MGGQPKEGGEGIFGYGLPGTGGDATPGEDVEGHVHDASRPGDDATVDQRRRAPAPFLPTDADPDVEGHLYRSGPTTQGEFTRRGPGEHPHGDR